MDVTEEDKFDEMISQLSTGNAISDKLSILILIWTLIRYDNIVFN